VSVSEPNLIAAWIGILTGFVTGSAIGLRFHGEEWMGGFASWRRRLTRLGHISFFGLALINLAFVLSAPLLHASDEALRGPSLLLIVGAVTMPTVCFLSAWRPRLRHGFVVPVGCLVSASAWVVVLLLRGRS
jgi:hypothetical protein